MNKNQLITLDITDMSVAGEGIGRYDGMPFFVANAVVGDRITAGITKLKKTYGYARLISIDEPSPDRIEAPCEVANRCGGCSVMTLDYDRQLKLKEEHVEETLRRIGGFGADEITQAKTPVIGMDKPFHYRNKSQYPVGYDRDGNIVIGFYAPHSHRIVEPPEEGCLIGNAADRDIISVVKDYMDKSLATPYDEETGKGLIRHILIRYGRATGEVMVCLVVNGTSIPMKELLVDMLLDKSSEWEGLSLKSVVLNENTTRSNVILGRRTKVLWGQDRIRDVLLGNEFEISANSFYQVNPIQTEKLYTKAIEYAGLTGNETVWDLCCGVGTISLCMAGKAKSVLGIEVVPEAIVDAKRNAKLNGIENVTFLTGKAEDILRDYDISSKDIPLPDVVVVDPPRKGLDGDTVSAILRANPERVVYVSCNPSTLARDLKLLCSDGRYTLTRYTPVDQFCHGMHVETVCLLSNRKPDSYVYLNLKMEDYYRIKDAQRDQEKKILS